MTLAAVLPSRHADALTLAEITWRVTDCRHDRNVRCGHKRTTHDALAVLARSGAVPLISDGTGYWLGTVDEVEDYLTRQANRRAEQAKRDDGLRRWRDAQAAPGEQTALWEAA